MKIKLLAVLTAGMVLLMISGPMLAHHGGAQYDTKHPLTMTGTVTEYLFTNPHVQIHIDVTGENGAVEKWIAETASPQRLYRLWLEREDFESRGQGHSHRCAAQRRPENRDHHQAHGRKRSRAHTGID